MNYKTNALTTEQYTEIIETMKQGFTGFEPNERIATALVLEGNLGLRIYRCITDLLAEIPPTVRAVFLFLAVLHIESVFAPLLYVIYVSPYIRLLHLIHRVYVSFLLTPAGEKTQSLFVALRRFRS